MVNRHITGKRLKRCSMVYALALLLSARADEATIREQVARHTLDKVPLWGVPADLTFSVPYPVVKAFFMDSLFPAQDVKKMVPVRFIRSEWTAHVSVSNHLAEVELVMNVDVLDASPFRPVMLDLFTESTVYEEITLDGLAITPIKKHLKPRNNQIAFQSQNQGYLQRQGQSLFGNPGQSLFGNGGSFQALEKLYVPLITTGRHCIRARIKPPSIPNGAGGHVWIYQPGYALPSVHFNSQDSYDVRIGESFGVLRGTDGVGTQGILPAKETVNQAVEVFWVPHREAVVKDGLPSYHTSTAWTIEERALTARSLMDVRITGGSLDQLNLILPPGADRVRITGADVRDTRINGSVATVFLKGRIRGATRLNIACTIPGSHQSMIALPDLGIRGGRTTGDGWMTVANDLGGELLENAVSGFEPVAALALPSDVSGLSHVAPTYAYRRESRNASARFDLIQTAPFPLVETIADTVVGHCMVRPDGQEIVKLHYDMRNNRAQFLEMKLPEGSRLLSVTVEEKVRTPSAHNGSILIPLPRSLQTMDGLISFPLNVIYMRKAAPLKNHKTRVIDLPELPGVPAARMSLTLFLPDELKLKEVHGPLQQVDLFTEAEAGLNYGVGFSLDTPGNEKTEIDAVAVEADKELYRNYYALGLESYKQNDFKKAEQYLEQAVTFSDGQRNNASAFGLLNNIKVVSGTDKPGSSRGRGESAKAKYISRSSGAKNVEQISVQSGLIAKGLEQIAAGDERGGAASLEKADQLGRELSIRGQGLEQKVVQSRYVDSLKTVHDNQRTNTRLREEVQELQRQAQTVVEKGKNGKSFKGQQLFFNLNAAALDVDYDAYDAEDLALGVQPTTPAPIQSVEFENRTLEKQAAVLKSALERTANEPAPASYEYDVANEAVRNNAKERLGETRRKLNRIIQDTSETQAAQKDGWATFDDAIALEELEELKTRTDSFAQVYATDEALADDVDELNLLIEEGEEKLFKARKQREQATQVVVGKPALLQMNGDAAPNTYQQQQLVELIIDNNDFVVGDDFKATAGTPVQVVNGNLTVANFGNNARILNETISNLTENKGNVVSFAGTNLDSSFLSSDNSVSKLFDQTTEQGQRYAVLDEAQFRALNNIQTARGFSNSDTGQRVVVPNTPNRVAGQRFQLEDADSNYNGLNIDGTRIDLEYDHYLAIENGGVVTILKGSQQHNWQERVNLLPELAPADVSPEIIFPAVGNPYRFEKTLLAEGESMDLVIEYRLARTD